MTNVIALIIMVLGSVFTGCVNNMLDNDKAYHSDFTIYPITDAFMRLYLIVLCAMAAIGISVLPADIPVTHMIFG